MSLFPYVAAQAISGWKFPLQLCILWSAHDAIRNKPTSSSLVLEGGSWLFFGAGLELPLLHGDWPGECARNQDGKAHHEKELTCWLSWLFSTGGCARSLNDTTSSHHPTPAAAYMLVENPPGEGMKEAISRSQSWEVETQKDWQPYGWHPSAWGWLRLFPDPQQSSRTCFANLNMHMGGDCEITFRQDPRWHWCCWLGPTLGTTRL